MPAIRPYRIERPVRETSSASADEPEKSTMAAAASRMPRTLRHRCRFDENDVSECRHRDADDACNGRNHADTSMSHALVEKEHRRDMERACQHRQPEFKLFRNYTARNLEHEEPGARRSQLCHPYGEQAGQAQGSPAASEVAGSECNGSHEPCGYRFNITKHNTPPTASVDCGQSQVRLPNEHSARPLVTGLRQLPQ